MKKCCSDTRVAEPAIASRCGIKLVHFLQCRGGNRGDDELRDTVTALEGNYISSKVDKYYFHLAPIISIYGTGSIGDREPVTGCQTAARTDLSLITGRDTERNAGRNESGVSGSDRDRLVDGCRKVESGAVDTHFMRKREIGIA
jgi:hypothetical protein